MTDISHPVKAINARDFSNSSLPAAATGHHTSHHHYDPSSVDDHAQEDDTISCVCGYADDDGWTVQCDKCNRWQHQLCYYPEYEEKTLPDIDHFCIDCHPRPVNVAYARGRQRQKREQANSLTNGARRGVSKSHKKKKESISTTYTNGWPNDKNRNDRTSAGPRDQPPPSKRPKTTHRTSDSTTATSKGHSRKRNASTAQPRRSLSRSPDTPAPLYSDEFLQTYVEDDWQVTNENIYGIATMNSMAKWLNGPDDEFRKELGFDKTDVYARWDGDLDDIPGKARIDILEYPDESVQYDGVPLVWKAVTVQEPIAEGAYIGELKGHVELQSEYQQDPANRWDNLRHPEPFVFFHPKLPIVVDARQSGTELRYIRRSCTPNARLQILVTGGVDYHFCFMATQQIEPGVEITIPWDTLSGLPELSIKTQVDQDYMVQLSLWVSNVLANCGRCACSQPEGNCKMWRFDRRGKDPLEETQHIKAPKSKKRKATHQISPSHTHAANSRSGSEVRRGDNDDKSTHSRSTSGSASRDITPNTHYSSNGLPSGMPELSERERKKLAKEEEMFRRQEEERSGKQAKKKRNSGGTSLNTTATSTKLSGPTSTSRYVDAGTSRQAGLASAKTHARQKSKAFKASAKPLSPIAKRAKPEYVSTGVQGDMDEDDAKLRAATPPRRKVFMPLRQRLLERCARNNAVVIGSTSESASPKSTRQIPSSLEKPVEADEKPETDETAITARPVLTPRDSTPRQAAPQASTAHASSIAEEVEPKPPPLEDDIVLTKSEPVEEVARLLSKSPPADVLPPVKRDSTSPPTAVLPLETSSGKGAPVLRLDMPPPNNGPGTASGGLLVQTPTALLPAVSQSQQQPHSLPMSSSLSVTAGALGPNSPASLASLTPISPGAATSPLAGTGVQQLQAQSQQRKKMSLSEYSKRNKNRGPASGADGPAGAGASAVGAHDRESSPASTASGPIAASTSLSAMAEKDRVVSSSSLAGPAIPEEVSSATAAVGRGDVKMEDVDAGAPSVPLSDALGSAAPPTAAVTTITTP